MTKRVPFTKESEREAVLLAETSGRTGKELAEDVGIGLSTLTRWISRNRDTTIDAPELIDANEDMAAELKRLRRENEILRQERDILKKATVFSPRREVDEVSFHRQGEDGIPAYRLCHHCPADA